MRHSIAGWSPLTCATCLRRWAGTARSSAVSIPSLPGSMMGQTAPTPSWATNPALQCPGHMILPERLRTRNRSSGKYKHNSTTLPPAGCPATTMAARCPHQKWHNLALMGAVHPYAGASLVCSIQNVISGLAESVLSRWRKEYQERGESAFLPPQSGESSTHEQRIAELERFCGQLALENQVLKKALQSRGSGSGMS